MNFACNRVWPVIAALLLTGIVACASVPEGDSCSVAHVDRVVYVRALQISAPEIKVTGKVVPGMAELVRDRIQNVFKREGVVVDAARGQAPGVAIYWNVVSANEAGMCYPATRYCLTFGYAPFYLR